MSNYRSQHTLKNGKTLIIRKPDESDAQALIDYMLKADGQTKFLAREPDEFDFTVEQERELIKKRADDPDHRFIVAEYDGHIVGSADATTVRMRKRFLHRATMGISVDKEHWGLGVGGRLMSEIVTWCRLRGYEQLELDVVADNERAIKLYENFGFIKTGRVPRAFKYADGSYADELTMLLDLR